MKRRTLLTFANPNAEPEKFATANLAHVSENELHHTRPRLAPNVEISIEDGEVTAAVLLHPEQPTVLFSISDEASTFFFNSFDGKCSLADAARLYSTKKNIAYPRSLQLVSEFARELYRQDIIVPANPGHTS